MKKLTIILPTEAKLEESEKNGLLSRWQFYFKEYSKHFSLEVYSCDAKDFSRKLNVKHIPLTLSCRVIPFFNQTVYNLFLIYKAGQMSRLIKVVSVSYFTLPVLKYLRKQILLSYPYDYEFTTKKDFGGILKGATAGIREYLSLKTADVIIASTIELRNKLKRKYNRNSVVIPNFVDLSKFYPRKKENYILYAGRIYWYKGIDFLIDAFKTINQKYPNLTLKLAGNGNLRFYKTASKKMNIKNIEFLGPVDYSIMPELMGKAKIFVLPTVNREGHPKALIEAGASGCACIATYVQGNREIISQGKNGLLVRPKDTHSIVEAITQVLGDEKLRLTLSGNARKTVLKFSLSNTLYKEINLARNMIIHSDV